MKQNQIAERPDMLTWGIILLAAKSAITLFFLTIAMVFVPVVFGVGAAEAPGDDAIPVVLVGMFGEFILFILAGLQVVALYACKRAWDKSRTWLIVVMILAALSAIDPTFIGLAVAALVIVGGVQALERTKEKEEAQGAPPAQPAAATADAV